MLALDPLGAAHLEMLRPLGVEGLDVCPHVRALVGVADRFTFGLRPFVLHPASRWGPSPAMCRSLPGPAGPQDIGCPRVSGPSIRARVLAGRRSRPRPCP